MIKCKLFDSIYLNNVTHIIGYAIDIKPNRLIEPRSGNQTYVRDIVLVDHRQYTFFIYVLLFYIFIA